MSGPSYVYEIIIGATADRIWQALTQGEFTRQYFHSTAVESDWQLGAEVIYRMPDGSDGVTGKVLEISRPNRLVITWRPLYDPDMAAESPSRVCFEIETLGPTCRLRVTHDQFEPGSLVYQQISQGWSAIVGSLKTLLETGRALPVAGNETEPVAEMTT
jgi:uncharacterized protein YndB with AHSA1/START domain